jgi:hypothetical protein
MTNLNDLSKDFPHYRPVEQLMQIHVPYGWARFRRLVMQPHSELHVEFLRNDSCWVRVQQTPFTRGPEILVHLSGRQASFENYELFYCWARPEISEAEYQQEREERRKDWSHREYVSIEATPEMLERVGALLAQLDRAYPSPVRVSSIDTYARVNAFEDALRRIQVLEARVAYLEGQR